MFSLGRPWVNNFNCILIFLLGYAITATHQGGMREVAKNRRWVYLAFGILVTVPYYFNQPGLEMITWSIIIFSCILIIDWYYLITDLVIYWGSELPSFHLLSRIQSIPFQAGKHQRTCYELTSWFHFQIKIQHILVFSMVLSSILLTGSLIQIYVRSMKHFTG